MSRLPLPCNGARWLPRLDGFLACWRRTPALFRPAEPSWSSRRTFRIECEKCGAMTRMVRLDETALVSGASMQEIRRDVEASGLHYTEEANGSFLICLNSLLK